MAGQRNAFSSHIAIFDAVTTAELLTRKEATWQKSNHQASPHQCRRPAGPVCSAMAPLWSAHNRLQDRLHRHRHSPAAPHHADPLAPLRRRAGQGRKQAAALAAPAGRALAAVRLPRPAHGSMVLSGMNNCCMSLLSDSGHMLTACGAGQGIRHQELCMANARDRVLLCMRITWRCR